MPLLVVPDVPFIEIAGGSVWYEEARPPTTPASRLPIVCLHSGWGRGVMPFHDAAAVLGSAYRLIFPDRRGYGRSSAIDELSPTYLEDGADELGALLDALDLRRTVLWGHSDGAIIAALYAARHRERVAALVLEAVHLRRRKSKAFFESFAGDPESLPPATIERLRADHGEGRWRTVIRMHSRAWLRFHALGGDFFDGKLYSLDAPVLLLYGENDLHTPTAETEELACRLRHVTLARIRGGGHSPHSEPQTARLCSERVLAFLRAHGL
jgi:pimeloyl-ACP methyl ester carboxylesterase